MKQQRKSLIIRVAKGIVRRRQKPLILPFVVVKAVQLAVGRDTVERLFVELRQSFPRRPLQCRDIVQSLSEYMNGFTLPSESLEFMDDILDRYKPQRICEFGSGLSTALFAYYSKHNASERAVMAFEHDKAFAQETRNRLRRLGLAGYAEIYSYPQEVDLAIPPDEGRTVDFVFVDGPPRTVGRAMTLVSVAPALKPGGLLILDDAFRQHERMCATIWKRMRLITAPKLVFVPHGMVLARLTGRDISGKHPGPIDFKNA